MAYPEPIPVLKGKEAKEFENILKTFKLSTAQEEFYREGNRRFKKKS